MAAASIDDLLRAESRLTRSFIGCVVAIVANIFWRLFLAGPSQQAAGIGPVEVGLGLLQAGLYLWYAISAGGAAKVLGDSGWKYVVWILAAPFLARIPIPIVSTLIAVSPLSIKFLLGGQLQTAIRQEGLAVVHGGS